MKFSMYSNITRLKNIELIDGLTYFATQELQSPLDGPCSIEHCGLYDLLNLDQLQN